jgi:hypothetical protein
MKTFLAFLCVLFTAQMLLADVYSAAMRQARNAAGNGGNSSQQNNRPPPSAPATPPVSPALQATLQNISALRADFNALGKSTEVKADSPEKKSLLDDLTAAAQGVKPSPTSTSKLADSLAAIAGKKIADAQNQKLAQDIHAIFNSSHLSQTQQETIFSDAQKILQDGGVTPDQTTNIITQIKTIAAETD